MAEDTVKPASPADPATGNSPADVKEAVEEALMDSIRDLLEGAEADVRIFVSAIANDLVSSAALGRKDLIKELKGQLIVMAEINRIRVAKTGNEILGRVVEAIGGFLVRSLANVDFRSIVGD